MTPRALTALAVADFRDRARRPSLLIAVLATVGLGYLAALPASANYATVKIGEFRGVYDSDYLGAMLAVAGGLWLSLSGFYLVKNALTRDTATGVGQILAAAPLSGAGYLLGKFLSNLLVLATIAGALAATAPVTQVLRGESAPIDLVALWLPFVLLCLPLLAISAAAAPLFESVPWLRGGIGNIVWFFGFPLAYVAGLSSVGMTAIGDSLRADLLAQHPDTASTEISVGLTSEESGLRQFTWSGLEVTGALVAQGAGYLLLAALLAVLPALWFHRFDPARARSSGRTPLARLAGGPASGAPPEAAPGEARTAAPVPPSASGAFAESARPRTRITQGDAFGRLASGELRVLLKGQSRWWWLGLLALTVAGLAVPAGDSLNVVLLAAWIWPLPLWSRLGTRAHEYGVHPLLGAAPSPRRRLLAEWGAGVLVTALAGAGPLARMLLEGDVGGATAWLAGALFVPALALLLGSASRGTRLFQFGYLLLWYGIANGVPAIDFMGAVREAGQLAGPQPSLVLAATTTLLAATLITEEIRHATR